MSTMWQIAVDFGPLWCPAMCNAKNNHCVFVLKHSGLRNADHPHLNCPPLSMRKQSLSSKCHLKCSPQGVPKNHQSLHPHSQTLPSERLWVCTASPAEFSSRKPRHEDQPYC